MKKQTSIVLVCILSLILVILAVFAFIPSAVSVGEYYNYNSPLTLLQKSGAFSTSVEAEYSVKFDDDVTADGSNVIEIISNRLKSVYNYYDFSCSFSDDGSKLYVSIPQTSESLKDNEKTTAESILSAVTSRGKVEITSTTSTTYSEDNVVLDAENIKSTKISRYVGDEQVYYIIALNLTDDGAEIASKKFTSSTSSWSAYCAIDETITYGVAYNDDTLQIYTYDNESAERITSYLNNDILDAKLTEIGTSNETEQGSFGMIAYIIVIALIVVSCIVFVVRYGKIGFAGVFGLVFSATAFLWFAGAIYFSFYNVPALIGTIIGIGLIDYLTVSVLEKIRANNISGKQIGISCELAFADSLKENIIVNAVALVLGVILWVIPTGFTAPLGNALVYCAVMSFATTLGLNRVFAKIFAGFYQQQSKRK